MFFQLFLFLALSANASSNRYFGTVPRILYAGRHSEITLSTPAILKSDVIITLRLSQSLKEWNYSSIVPSDQTGTMHKIIFYVPESMHPNDMCSLYIKASGGISFDHVKRLQVKRLTGKIIIQTDKPMYKPGGKVKFRVIAMDENLKPNVMVIEEIFITNPTGSRMIQWINATLDSGMISLEMPLSIKPVLGNWKITAKSNGMKETRNIIVKKYVMPKFEVTITSAPYLLRNDKTVTFKVCAKYTYGKMVSGKLDVMICQNYRKNNCQRFQKTIIGCTDVIYRKASIRMYGNLKANANVTEDGTATVITSKHETRHFVNSDIMVKFEAPKHYRPGFMYKIKLLVNTPDGRPFVGERSIQLTITRRKENYLEHKVFSKTVNVVDGVYEHTVFPVADSRSYTYQAIYRYQPTRRYVHPKKLSTSPRRYRKRYASGHSTVWYSPSKTYLKITYVSDVTVGKTSRIYVSFSQNSIQTEKHLNYMIVCKGRIVVAAMERVSPGPNAHINFIVTQDMAPKCRILVYYILADGEFISDNKMVTIGASFRNKVSMAFSSTEKFPGDNVDLLLKAEPGSLFAIAAVDKSILLMASNNDVKESDLTSFLSNQDITPLISKGCYRRRKRSSPMRYNYWGLGRSMADGRYAIEQTGLEYFTNARVKVKPCRSIGFNLYEDSMVRQSISVAGLPGPSAKRNFRMNSQPTKQKSTELRKTTKKLLPKDTTKIRTEFPETWLWAEEYINSSGEKKLSVKIPDTITTWHTTGFAISPSVGIGVASSTNLRAFQAFFVSLSLPYSVKRGETVKIPATVFNYLDKCLVVKVALKQTSDFVAISNLTSNLCVCGSSSKTFKFSLKPTTLGKIDISITGKTDSSEMSNTCDPKSSMTSDITAADGVNRQLLVEAEGIKKEYSKSIYFCQKDSNSGKFIDTLSLALPKTVVPGSTFAEIAITGDLLGPSMDGLDKLLAMPYGCGEQNMLKFAPNIYIMDYLMATNQATPAIENNAKEYMRSGYQRELTYKHNTGAYSAFGERDKEGSTWLTAFVLRTYAQARRYIFIDPKEIRDSKEWLLSLQLSSGCFKEVGMVHHKEMKGGVTSGITMTAFILIALLEADTPHQDARVQKALGCIERQLDDVNDYYTAAVLAFALKFGGSTKAQLMLNKLKDGAITDGGMHWEDKKKQKNKQPSWYYYQARSADIETTSYTLMAFMSGSSPFGSRYDHLSIVKWLVKQRNPYGGFSSTQDTCVGLQALSSYAATGYSGSFDLNIKTKYSSKENTYNVNDVNKLVLQKQQIESLLPLDIEIMGKGKGCALVQANVKYNEPQPGNETSFMLHVEVKQDKKSFACLHKVKVCGSYTGTGKSNMALIDVNMVSGFEPATHLLDEAIQTDLAAYTQYEFDDGVLSFYFDEFEQKSQCAEFSIEQVAEVEERKPASLTIYDYYDKGDSATTMYAVGECPDMNVVS